MNKYHNIISFSHFSQISQSCAGHAQGTGPFHHLPYRLSQDSPGTHCIKTFLSLFSTNFSFLINFHPGFHGLPPFPFALHKSPVYITSAALSALLPHDTPPFIINLIIHQSSWSSIANTSQIDILSPPFINHFVSDVYSIAPDAAFSFSSFLRRKTFRKYPPPGNHA